MPCSGDPLERIHPPPVQLATLPLQCAWQEALSGIGRATNTLLILHHVSTAQGFVWALQVGNTVTDDEAQQMNAIISYAERAAFRRLAGGKR
ncbi:hypothetical protein SAMN04489798_4352 [Pseudomonas arsenicoxydans]|uniref:Uncharacterized protein n=1 Tax=Pseudomonas arsenicoxydans TaxID=702115 RepID=A0A1H0NYI4_9PSED|nr:hypothetical protein [Pseudomonas arsenicoxydans]SDO97744.1 hypothetical protein SAMN04489798_4352 [Pseudomonas arsenicoxydans]